MLIACASTTKPDAQKAEIVQAKTQEVQTAASETSSNLGSTVKPDISTDELAGQESLVQLLKKNSVYFDIDTTRVKPEFHGVIRKQGDFMLSNKNDTVTLEGNCDERGSAEFNLALGDRRAKSVSRQLQLLGIPKERISTVSNGEGRPRLACHEESCWKENRRVDFIYNLNQAH